MATVNWEAGYNGVFTAGVPSARAVTLSAVNDVSEWTPVSGEINILVRGGTSFTIEIYRCTQNNKFDSVLVDTQDNTERVAAYRFVGDGFVQIKLTALVNGPIVVRING